MFDAAPAESRLAGFISSAGFDVVVFVGGVVVSETGFFLAPLFPMAAASREIQTGMEN